jgi:uncharacterized protein (DUF362 family)
VVELSRRSFLKRSATGAAVLAAGSGMLKNSAFAMNPSMAQAKSDVSFVGSSASGTRQKMIADVLAPLKNTVAAGIAGKTVLIKVNMVQWSSFLPDPKLVLTHVDAVRGCIDFLRSINASVPIVVGDCTCSPEPIGDITTMFGKAGYSALTSEYAGVTLEDLDTYPSVGRQFWTPDLDDSKTVSIPIVSAFFDPAMYYIISLCRPKTHSAMILSGVNKNILMGAPHHSGTVGGATTTGIPKRFMHGGPEYYTGKLPNEIICLSYNLFQMANNIYSADVPSLAVLDAWEGMEGEGPANGTSIMQYCAAASIDPLAVDRIAAKLMGFSDTPTDPPDKANPSYTDMRVLVWISNAGFGNYDLSKINFILGSVSDVEKYVKSYKLPRNYTGTPSYETEWTGGPPPVVLNETGVKDSRYLDPMPYLVPQMHNKMTASKIKIDFTLPVSFLIYLGIFTMQGVEVRRLGYESLPGGRYSVVWNLLDNTGSRVPAGRYIIKLGFGSRSLCDQIALVK